MTHRFKNANEIGVVKRYFIISSIFVIMILSYQNCSFHEFTVSSAGAFKNNCELDARYSKDCPNYGFETESKVYTTNPTDLLFVLDDSCSMQKIANQVRDGFNSISKSQFPDNTLMALTYMSPSNVMSDGTVDYANAWSSLKSSNTKKIIKITPGHMDLVNRNKISEFKNQRPKIIYEGNISILISDFVKLFPSIDYENPVNKIKKNGDGTKLSITPSSTPTADEVALKLDLRYLTKAGCNKSWFEPSEVDLDRVSCLEGVTQLVNLCTGAEAGLLSLEQMLNLKTSKGEKVFRDNAFVNIILVSDTHEAGDNYFGTEGAASKMSTLSQIQSSIQKNNLKISSIKINGVVPIPPVGDHRLEGLNIVGAIPQTIEESKVSSEDLYDFSYLPYIKDTNGVVAHASNSDWSGIASKIIDESSYTGQIVVNLKSPAKIIYDVKVNDVSLNLDDVILSEDKQSVFINYRSLKNTQIKIEVEYMKDIYF